MLSLALLTSVLVRGGGEQLLAEGDESNITNICLGERGGEQLLAEGDESNITNICLGEGGSNF